VIYVSIAIAIVVLCGLFALALGKAAAAGDRVEVDRD
jgi:hypothetical protein